MEGAKQTIAQGPVASEEAIKELGTNGGGFFNANSAHPFENPSPLTNLFEMWLILVIPARVYVYLRQNGRRHSPGLGHIRRLYRDVPGRRVLFAMDSSRRETPLSPSWAFDQTASATQAGGNMEGKEIRLES